MTLPIFDIASQRITPDFAVRIEGIPLAAPVLKSIMNVTVNQFADGSSSFSLQVNDPSFQLTDTVKGFFSEGKRVEIAMGYVGRTRSMIVGDITAISVDLEESGGFTLNAQGFDRLHAATRGTKYREFRDDQTDSDIVSEIATALKLTPSVEKTKARNDRQIQNNKSDLDFLESLAKINGFDLWVDGDVLNFKKERSIQTATVARGRDLISFSARLSTAGHVDSIEVRGMNTSEKTAFHASAEAGQVPDYSARLSETGRTQVSSGGSGKTKRVIHTNCRVSTIDEAKNLAEAMMRNQRRDLLTANGSVVGNQEIRAGGLLKIENIGRFSGSYVVETADHTIGSAGYRTSFTLRSNL